jgi:hypothetical protein
VDHESTAADDIRRLNHAQEGIPQERGAQSLPFLCNIDGQAREQNDRDGVRRQAFRHARRRFPLAVPNRRASAWFTYAAGNLPP